MSDDDPIRDYVTRFARLLSGHGFRGRRLLEEIECHLRELADALYRRGLEPAAAAREAIARFGSPDEVLRQFELEAPLESEVMTMVRTLLKPLAWATIALAALFLVMSWFDDAPQTAFMVKAAVSAFVIGCGLIVLHQTRMAEPRSEWQRAVVLAGAVLALVIGSAGVVWTAHLGIITGDWEYYGFGVCGLLMLLGILSAAQLTIAAPRGDSLTD
jgi:hypothetical protein